jgi:cytosine/adenosine deaminase-related metal-dependent hydrolase
MTYRKFKADYLFLGDQMAGPDSVLITTEEGIVRSVVSEAGAGEGIERYRGLLCPGFINCHCHLELSHLKGLIPEGTGLVDFLSMVIRRRGESAAEDVAAAIAAAEQEMLDNGIVAVGDICNTEDTLGRKRAGRMRYYNFIETIGFIDHSAADRFSASRRVFEAFEKGGVSSIVPHAPYSVSPALFGLVAGFAGGRLLTMHSQESSAENEFYLTGRGGLLRLYAALGLDVSWFGGTGKRSLESVLPHFDRGQPMILVHNVDTGKEDLEVAAAWRNLFFCHCPNANLYIGGRLPDVRLLVERGCRMVVGTDSLASNHQLSILEELKTLQRAFPGLELSTLLQWATANGAVALGMDDILGEFAPGKAPGVLLLQGLAGDRLAPATTVKRLI